MKTRIGRKKGRRKGQKKAQPKSHRKAAGGGRRRSRVPPPESELWPVWCRGKLWEPVFAKWFAGRCQLCAYSCQPTEGRRRRDAQAGLLTMLLCTDHPDSPGHLRDVWPTETCRNFKAARWLRPRSGTRRKGGGPALRPPRGKVRRIPLGRGLFATVDARDYKWLSKYKWCVLRKSGAPYAVRRTKDGRMVYMHREIMNAPKGRVVDHIDHNTLNNRRCNLRICTPGENQANAGPRGSASGYVGVKRVGNKWEAEINYRGKRYYLGRYDDPIEAAKVRDRRAYELHGPLAYTNLPEELQHWLRQEARKKARARARRPR
jgi:hypothetical protein